MKKNIQLFNNNIKLCYLSSFFLLYFVFVIPFTIHATENNLKTITEQSIQKKITLNIKNKSLDYILTAIKKQANIDFGYQSGNGVNKNELFTIEVKNIPVEQALNEMLKSSKYSFTMRNNMIIIFVKKIVTSDQKSITLKGKVMDKYKKPIPGATIFLKGTSKGAISNEDGQFSLLAKVGQEILITYVGMKDVTKSITDKTSEIVYIMEEDMLNMEEVVITGMFNKAKESYTGAATFISKKELTDFKSRNLLRTIANIDPSFNIVENNKLGSNPNALPEINIRGMTNFPPVLSNPGGDMDDIQSEQRTNLNTPLFILDGFEISLERMMDLDDDEIENVTILKDASSTAIYGSRGSNGVVVITSVKPEAGKLRVSVKGSMNFEVPDLSSYNVLNAKEKLELEVLAGYFKAKPGDPYTTQDKLDTEYMLKRRAILEGKDTYWLSQPLTTGLSGNYGLSLSGGDRSFRYSLSGSYNTVKGVMKGSDRNNLNASLTITYLYKSLQFSNVVTVGMNTNEETLYGSFSQYAAMNPYYSPFDKNGNMVMRFNLAAGSGSSANEMKDGVKNPMYDASTTSYNNGNYTNLRNGTSFEYAPVKTVKISARFGFSQNTNERHDFKSATHSIFDGEADALLRGSYTFGTSRSKSVDGALTLSYAEVFGKHSLFVGLNGELRESTNVSYSINTRGFSHERLDFLSMASSYDGNAPGGSESTSRAAGLTGNINYNWNHTLFVDGSYRLDGASTFGSFNRFKPFYSIGAGWTVTGMKFMKESVPFISTLRVKYNYGVTGSLPFQVYDAFTTFRYNIADRYEGLMGANIIGYGNPSLTWQYTYSQNAGFELSILKSKLSFSGNIYKRVTKGTITKANLPLSHGFENYTENQGDIQNTGYDASVQIRILNLPKRQLSWNMRLGIQSNQNKLLRLSNAMKEYSRTLESKNAGVNSAPFMLFREGESMNALYVVQSLGIDPATGEELFLKRNGTVSFQYSPLDKMPCGLRDPKVTGALSTSLRYKKFNLSLSFGIRLGGQYYNNTLVSKVENADPRKNVDRRVFDERWRGVNHYSKYKGLTAKGTGGMSSRFMQDESTIKCNSLNISYAASSKWLKKHASISSINFTANTSDLFQISTIKQERGTGYPFARKIALQVSIIF